MPKRRDWKRERTLLLLLLMAVAPVVWAMFVAIAVAALPPPDLRVDLSLSVDDHRVDATVEFVGADPRGVLEAEVNWGDGMTEGIPSPVRNPFTACHMYEEVGDYAVVARVDDSVDSATSTKLAEVFLDIYDAEPAPAPCP